MASNVFQCQIVNNTGEVIFLKIIGHEPTSQYFPDLAGVDTGIFFADPPLNQDLQTLTAGKRVVIAWSSDGNNIRVVQQFDLSADATIRINKNSVTQFYSAQTADGSGKSLNF
jgi:hypothetical protein